MRSERQAISALTIAVLAVLMLVLPVFSQDVESVAVGAKPSVAVVLVQRADGRSVSGTAFIAAEGLALTAEHVIANSRRIAIKFPHYDPMEARLVASDIESDVAVLSIPRLHPRPLPLGDISQVREGQRVVVVGFPRIDVLGAEAATVTEGIVGAVRPGLIQMQAPVNPGNSGGPVLSMKGEVIGIVRGTLRGQQQGLNFATPINLAKRLLSTLPTRVPPAQTLPQPPVRGAELTIRVLSLTSPVRPGTDAMIEIQTAPGARCSIMVVYGSGPSRASGLAPRTADDDGQIAWIWRVGSNTTPGTWPIFIECTLGQEKVETQTEFTVR